MQGWFKRPQRLFGKAWISPPYLKDNCGYSIVWKFLSFSILNISLRSPGLLGFY